MRLFAAVPLHPRAVERLVQLRLRLSAPRDGLRWSQPEQWHITLRYFGDVDEATALELARVLRSVECPGPELRIDALGLFPAKGILFAGVAATPELLLLQAQVERLAAHTGLIPESRPFHPHITLARSRNTKGVAALQRLSRPALPSLGPEIRWRAQEILLYRSELMPEGAMYVVVDRLSLAP